MVKKESEKGRELKEQGRGRLRYMRSEDAGARVRQKA